MTNAESIQRNTTAIRDNLALIYKLLDNKEEICVACVLKDTTDLHKPNECQGSK